MAPLEAVLDASKAVRHYQTQRTRGKPRTSAARYSPHEQKGRPVSRTPLFTSIVAVFLVHAAHTAGAAWATAGRSRLLLVFLDLRDERFRREHQAGNRSRVLQRETGNLGWVNNAHLHHVAVLPGFRVETVVLFLRLADLADHHSAFSSGVVRDLAGWLFKSAPHDADANSFVILELQLVDRRDAAQQRGASAGNNAFLDGCAGRVHGIFDASLFFLQLGFSCRAHLDDRHSADQLGKPLLELFLVVVGCSVLHLRTDLLDASFDVSGLAIAFHDRGVVLVDGDFLGAAQILKLHIFQLKTQVLGNRLAARERRDILEHGLATVAKARSLDGSALQRATKLVDHQGRQRFAFHVLSNDQEGLAHLGGLLQQRQQILHRADFLFVDQDAAIFQNALHALRIGNEVRRQVAAVELHTLDHFQRRFHGLGFFHGDDAVLADLLHRFGNDPADLLVVVGGNGANLRDHVALHVFVQALDLFHGSFHRAFNAALQSCRAGSCRYGLHAFAEDRLRQNGRCGGSVASHVAGLGSHFANHLRAHVLEWIAQFDFLRYRYAVLGDDRRAELLFDYRVAALGAEGNLHCVGKCVHAAQNRLAGRLTCYYLLRHTGNSS